VGQRNCGTARRPFSTVPILRIINAVIYETLH
jgi:hypothetical protein